MAFSPAPMPAAGPLPMPAPMSSPGAYGAAMPPVDGVVVVADAVAPAKTGVPLSTLKKWFLAYQDAKQAEMIEARDARLYYHGAQWTDEQRRTLELQGRPVVWDNRISLKIDGIVGVVDRLRQDPKASARTQMFAAGAQIGTAAVREMLDSNRWEALRQEVSHDLAVEGIGGCERDVEMDADGQPNTVLRRVAPYTFFYDPRSMKPDFSDARYMGVYKWVDLDAAIEMVPEREEDLRNALDLTNGTDTVAQQDIEKNWFDGRLDRVKLVEVWYRQRGEWRFALHTGSLILKEGPSPWLDRRGKTRCRYNMASANIDQDGDRYGFVRNMRPLQDSVNHRKSKALWMMSVNQVLAKNGAVDDPDDTRDKLARPDSWITYNDLGGEGPSFTIRDMSGQMQGQFEILGEDKAALDNFGPTPALLGQGPGSASGRAQALQQQAGIAQLGPYFGRFKAWKLGLYRDLWADVQQFWTLPRAIRVAGPEEFNFIDVNKLVMTPTGPRIANAIGELDLDIVMDEGPDTVTLHEDVMNAVSAMIQQGLLTGPQAIKATLELSDLSPAVKQAIIAAGAPPQPSPEQAQLQQTATSLQLHAAASKIAKTEAETDKLRAETGHTAARTDAVGIEAEQHAVNTAATIADIAQKTARTRQIGTETAQAHMAALGAPAMVAPAAFAPRPLAPPLQGLPA